MTENVDLARPIHEMRTRRSEPIGEILRFVRRQSAAEFHDDDLEGWHAIITEDEFALPEIAAADDLATSNND